MVEIIEHDAEILNQNQSPSLQSLEKLEHLDLDQHQNQAEMITDLLQQSPPCEHTQIVHGTT